MVTNIEVTKALFEEKFILENLLQLYEYNMSQYEKDAGPGIVTQLDGINGH